MFRMRLCTQCLGVTYTKELLRVYLQIKYVTSLFMCLCFPVCFVFASLCMCLCVPKCVLYGMCVVGLCAYVNQGSRTLNKRFV